METKSGTVIKNYFWIGFFVFLSVLVVTHRSDAYSLQKAKIVSCAHSPNVALCIQQVDK